MGIGMGLGMGEISSNTFGNTTHPNDWKVTDYSSVNFHNVFYFIFCQIIAENEEKLVMEIYGWVANKVFMDP